jgi:hypothetical protein
LGLLAEKIRATVEQKEKEKNLKVVKSYRAGPERRIVYVVENENG